jgi:hypothetical protein
MAEEERIWVTDLEELEVRKICQYLDPYPQVIMSINNLHCLEMAPSLPTTWNHVMEFMDPIDVPSRKTVTIDSIQFEGKKPGCSPTKELITFWFDPP